MFIENRSYETMYQMCTLRQTDRYTEIYEFVYKYL